MTSKNISPCLRTLLQFECVWGSLNLQKAVTDQTQMWRGQTDSAARNQSTRPNGSIKHSMLVLKTIECLLNAHSTSLKQNARHSYCVFHTKMEFEYFFPFLGCHIMLTSSRVCGELSSAKTLDYTSVSARLVYLYSPRSKIVNKLYQF